MTTAPGDAFPVSLYVYYRVDADACDAAASAVLASQAALALRHRGAVFELLRRPGADADGRVTLMETMRLPAGTDATAVEAAAAAASAPWLASQRQVETFVPMRRQARTQPPR